LLEKDTALNFLVWHKNGTKEAFLMHITAILDAIKKHGHFKDYKKAERAHDEAKQAVKLAKVGLALLDGTSGGKKNHKKKALAKAKEAAMEAAKKATKETPGMVPNPKSESNEAEEAPKVNSYMIRAGFQVDLAKAKQLPQVRCSCSTQTCFLLRASTHGTRLSASRQTTTRLLTYKASLWKAQGECLVSCLTTASCFTFSLRFPSMQPSKKSTMSPMYLRSLSTSMYVSLYIA
jgi:hypothetical protein